MLYTLPMKAPIPYLLLPRPILWELYLAFEEDEKKVIAKGTFNISIFELDRLGKEWGESVILGIGRHHSLYQRHTFLHRMSGSLTIPTSTGYEARTKKIASSGITGGIGEVLVSAFLKKVLSLNNTEIAHLDFISRKPTPDFIVDSITQNKLVQLLDDTKSHPYRDTLSEKAKSVCSHLKKVRFPDPFPIESKSSRKGIPSTTDGFNQLLSYWLSVPSMTGYGIIARNHLENPTVIKLNLFLPFPPSKFPSAISIQQAIKNPSNEGEEKNKKTYLEIIKDAIGGTLFEGESD